MKVLYTIAVILSGALTAFGQKDLKQNSIAMENDVISSVRNIFIGADEHNWTKIHDAMSESVLLDYSSLSGNPAATVASIKIIEAWKQFLPGFDRTHHHLTDFIVHQQGSSVAIQFRGKADHFIGKEVWTVEGTYEVEAVEVHDQWKVRKLKFNLLKQGGNTNLPAQAIGVLKNKNITITKKKVQFYSDGLVLVGNLYMPPQFEASKKYPAILVGGSWTTVKEQMSGLYAEKLAHQGYITLAFDPRYFGESEGKPRFWENASAKIADFKNAITYLATIPGVDANNIFLTAICASAGYMAVVTSEDDRVKGLVTVAGWLHDGEAVKLFYGGNEGVQTRIKQAQYSKKKFAKSGIVDYVRAISTTDSTAAMFGNYDYYLNATRGAIPQWSSDKFAVMSWEDWLTFDPMPFAKRIQVPTIMIHSDDAVLPNNVKKFFDDMPTKDKVLHWTVGTQFDFYDNPTQTSYAVTVIDDFLKRNLK